MLVVIPYKDYGPAELKYCLRGIEKFIEDPEIIIIGDFPSWLQNVTHIKYNDNPELQFKERNIFEKLLLVKHDFLFFNDDHLLLEPFAANTYHYSGKISERIKTYSNNPFRATVQNTFDLCGDINNYYRHCPMFCRREILNTIAQLDWQKPWGYCIKSIYCNLAGIEGTDYPDLKIRMPLPMEEIRKQVAGRPYFSTINHALNPAMITFLEETYPHKSKFEK